DADRQRLLDRRQRRQRLQLRRRALPGRPRRRPAQPPDRRPRRSLTGRAGGAELRFDPWLKSQQSMANLAARQTVANSSPARSPTLLTSTRLGSGAMLSKLATQGRDRPWAGPRGTSVGMSRTRVVTGATRMVVSWTRTELRVEATTARR